MTSRRAAARLVAVLGLVLASSGAVFLTEEVQGRQPAALVAPEKFFGFQMGADRKLANWDKRLEYYRHVGEDLIDEMRRPLGHAPLT